MTQFTVCGLVIKESVTRENDKILTVLTAERGKLTFKAKGAKKQESKNSCATQLFAYSEFDLMEKNGSYLLKSGTVKSTFDGLRNNLEGFFLACYFLEIANKMTNEGQNESEILRLILNSIYVLSQKKYTSLELVRGAFEIKFMHVFGFLPNLSYCLYCNEDIDTQKDCYFNVSEGNVFCIPCYEKMSDEDKKYAIKISPSTLKAINYVCFSNTSKFLSFNLSNEYIAEFSLCAEKYFLLKAEKKFDTLNYYKKMLKN